MTPSPVGTWRSLVAHLLGVQGVAGSNPVVPTIFHFKPRFETATKGSRRGEKFPASQDFLRRREGISQGKPAGCPCGSEDMSDVVGSQSNYRVERRIHSALRRFPNREVFSVVSRRTKRLRGGRCPLLRAYIVVPTIFHFKPRFETATKGSRRGLEPSTFFAPGSGAR